MRPIVGGPWDGSWTKQEVDYFVVPVYEPLKWGPRPRTCLEPLDSISYKTFEYRLDILRQKDFNGEFPPIRLLKEGETSFSTDQRIGP
jgi:hypothetical protein